MVLCVRGLSCRHNNLSSIPATHGTVDKRDDSIRLFSDLAYTYHDMHTRIHEINHHQQQQQLLKKAEI